MKAPLQLRRAPPRPETRLEGCASYEAMPSEVQAALAAGAVVVVEVADAVPAVDGRPLVIPVERGLSRPDDPVGDAALPRRWPLPQGR